LEEMAVGPWGTVRGGYFSYELHGVGGGVDCATVFRQQYMNGELPPLSSPLGESEGYKPADFDRPIEIAEESGSAVEIDDNVLPETMPDFIRSGRGQRDNVRDPRVPPRAPG
jgi:hypothetical protein